MKTYRRFIAMLLAGILLFSCVPAHAITNAEKDGYYSAALEELETYLENSGNSSADLAGIESTFRELGGYEQSRFLRYYVAVLMKIADESYDYELYTFLDILETNAGFKKYLEEDLKGSAIGTVEELKIYAAAREEEAKGNIDAAMSHYKTCSGFFDSSEHYLELRQNVDQAEYEKALELLRNGDMAGAYYCFLSVSPYEDSDIMIQSIQNQLGYTPSSPTDNLAPVAGLKATNIGRTEITLSWNHSNRAACYEVYYKKNNSSNWSDAGSVNGTTKTITGLEEGTGYDFKVLAAAGRVKAAETFLTNQKTASATPTPKPTPKPTPTPTPTPALSAAALGFTYEKVSANTVSIKKYTGSATKLVIPDQLDGFKVVAIGNYAFSGCTNLTSVTIPNSVTSIGSAAFYNCTSLTSVIIPNSVTSIGDSAFNKCSSLTSVTIPNSVTIIGNTAFYNCTSLTSVTIPNGVTSIGGSTFDNCTSLTNVIIPNSVTRIGNSAFCNCKSLTRLTIPNSVTNIGSSAFNGCANLTSVTIPNSVTSIGSYAFSGCKNLTIYGFSNTDAERYAKAYGIPFVRK